MNDPNAAINQNGKRIGTVMNKLPLDASNVVRNYIVDPCLLFHTPMLVALVFVGF